MVAARSLRVRRRDPEDGRRQVPQDRAARHVRRVEDAGALNAVVLSETGGPDVLRYGNAADPVAEPGQKLVAVRAAGINFMDLLIRQGRYPQAPELPVVLGGEIAGEVGGRRVMGLPRTGGYGELAAVDERWLVPLPDGASFAEGAAFLMAFLTAWLPLTRQARVEPGSVVL